MNKKLIIKDSIKKFSKKNFDFFNTKWKQSINKTKERFNNLTEEGTRNKINSSKKDKLLIVGFNIDNRYSSTTLILDTISTEFESIDIIHSY